MIDLRLSGTALLEAAERARRWVKRSNGLFSGYILGKECGLNEPQTRNQVLDELVRLGEIQCDGNRNNWYRRVSNELEPIQWEDAKTEEYPIWLPFGLNELGIVSPGNIILVAGESNAGKTAFLLQVIKQNLKCNGGEHEEISLFNSEMTAGELKKRLLGVGQQYEWEGLRPFYRRRDFHQVIRPDGFNVIDYMQITDNFWQVGEYIERIHETLGYGIAIVCLQKKKGELYGRGGEFAQEKPRLSVSLFHDGFVNTIKITKFKETRGFSNVDGLERDFTIQRGGLMIPCTDWEYVDKKDRERRTSVYRLKAERERRAQGLGGTDE